MLSIQFTVRRGANSRRSSTIWIARGSHVEWRLACSQKSQAGAPRLGDFMVRRQYFLPLRVTRSVSTERCAGQWSQDLLRQSNGCVGPRLRVRIAVLCVCGFVCKDCITAQKKRRNKNGTHTCDQKQQQNNETQQEQHMIIMLW